MGEKTLQLISYNVNGIRSAISKGLIDWLAGQAIDVLCFQEVKATHDVVDLKPFEDLGYCYHWHSAEKKGYSGVATFSRIKPDQVVIGCGIPAYDCEGRILRTDFGDWTLLNCYFPSGTTGEVRQAVKMQFLEDFYTYAQALKQERPKLIIVGDYNIANTERDIHDPVRNKNTTGFLPEERAWMNRWFASGFHDAFRLVHPEKVEYSWWSYRAGARTNNKGWRIDYVSVSDALKEQVIECRHLKDGIHADHCAVWAELVV